MNSDLAQVENGPPTPSATYKVYKARWYILAMFCLLGVAENMISTTMSPIGPIAEPALHLTQTDIALLANWFNVGFFITLIPYTWLLQTKGLRMPMISAAICTTLGASIRCLHVTTVGITIFDKVTLHLGHMVNSIPSSVLWFGCTKLSVVWFPPSERIISTTIGLVFGPFGSALNFLVGPYVVTSLAKAWAGGDDPALEDYALAIRYMFYGQAIFCAILCTCTLIYFPSEPPTPPSYTAKSERTDYWHGFLQFCKNPDAWVLVTLSSVSSAFLNGWTQFLSITMHDVMDEIQTGWLGFAMLLAALISSPIASLTSRWWLSRYPRLVPAAILSLGAIATVIFLIAKAFVRSMLIPAVCWSCLLVASLSIQSCQPLYWEMAVEAVYPVPEQITAGFFTLGNTIISIVFYVLYSVPTLGTAWTNWCLAISECLCVPIIFFYSGQKRRLADDERAINASVNEGQRTDNRQNNNNEQNETEKHS